MTDAEADASSNFRFSRNESRKKSKTKNKSLKKLFFSGKKKNKSFAIDRESIERDKCGMFVRNIFLFLKSDEKEIRDARARERER